MEKNVKVSMLCQIYGKLLTKKQLSILEDYYNQDLSLSEIAENKNITRQAVRDIIKKGESKLFELEEKLGIMKRMVFQMAVIIGGLGIRLKNWLLEILVINHCIHIITIQTL